MLIALNIVMAGIVLVAIVTLLARQIDTKNEVRTVEAGVTPDRHAARTHNRQKTPARPVGAHF